MSENFNYKINSILIYKIKNNSINIICFNKYHYL